MASHSSATVMNAINAGLIVIPSDTSTAGFTVRLTSAAR